MYPTEHCVLLQIQEMRLNTVLGCMRDNTGNAFGFGWGEVEGDCNSVRQAFQLDRMNSEWGFKERFLRNDQPEYLVTFNGNSLQTVDQITPLANGSKMGGS